MKWMIIFFSFFFKYKGNPAISEAVSEGIKDSFIEMGYRPDDKYKK
jgi:hypothetical protein